MNKNKSIKKIIKTCILLGIIIMGLHYFHEALIQMEPTNEQTKNIIDFVAKFDSQKRLLIALYATLVILLFTWTSEMPSYEEVLMIKYKYLYSTFKEEERVQLDQFSDEDKLRFTNKLLELKTTEEKNNICEKCVREIKPSLPKLVVYGKRCIILSLLLMLVINGQGIGQYCTTYYNNQKIKTQQQQQQLQQQQIINEQFLIEPADDPQTVAIEQMIINNQIIQIKELPVLQLPIQMDIK